MATIYRDRDADLTYLEKRIVGVIGYGNQGRSQAQNLRDSGVATIIGSPRDASADQAQADGFQVYSIAEASKRADVLLLLLPDEVLAQVYHDHIATNLRAGMVLTFASGYNITFGLLVPPPDVDVILIAPRMGGKGVRDTFLEGIGFPSLVGIGQDTSGHALEIALALAKAIGSTRRGAMRSSFREETMVDLLTEHVGSIYFTRMLFDTLVEAGCDPEVVLLELYASGELVEYAKDQRDMGLWNQLRLHSRTSQYGQQVTSLRFMDVEATRDQLRRMLAHIQSGEFAKEWQAEQRAGSANLRRITDENLQHPMQKAENGLYRRLGRRREDVETADWLTGGGDPSRVEG
jgi:ketol-acid reductoisomerase